MCDERMYYGRDRRSGFISNRYWNGDRCSVGDRSERQSDVWTKEYGDGTCNVKRTGGASYSCRYTNRKIRAIERAIEKHQPDKEDVLDVLSKVGGLDIAGMTGAFLGGAIYHIPVLIDGFISSAAALCAVRMVPETADYILASHCSGEPAGRMVLEELKLPYLIDAKMSLGEGSGAVAAIPLLEMGVNVYRKMSTFEEIKVEQYEELK